MDFLKLNSMFLSENGHFHILLVLKIKLLFTNSYLCKDYCLQQGVK